MLILGQKVATREAYGTALAKLATAHPRVVALDCDVKNSTFAINILKAQLQFELDLRDRHFALKGTSINSREF